MGLYMYVSEQDRIIKRKVSEEIVNEEFQEALKYDPSLMIEEHYHKIVNGVFKKRIEYKTTFSVYHETPAHDGSAFQARLQASASGDKKIVIAYLHGIINGAVHRERIAGSSLRFSDWVKSGYDDLEKAGEGYAALSELSQKCIDYAVERYIAWLKAQ